MTASSNPKFLQATTTFTSKSQQPSLTVDSVPHAHSVSREQFITKSGQFVTTSEHSVTKSEQLTTKSGQSVIKSEQIASKAWLHSLLVWCCLSFVTQTLVITADELLAITKTICIAYIMGDLTTAEKVLTQEITADTKNFASYANHSFVMARRLSWENALQDANKVTTIHHALVIDSLTLMVA